VSDELFSHRLRRFRELNGYSQDDAGALLGVTGRYIGMMERGEKDVEPTSSIYKLFGLLEANKVHPSEFAGARGTRESPVEYEVTSRPSSHASAALTLPDVLAQVRSDMDLIEKGTMAEKRRAFIFLRDVHLPCVGRLLKID
jgi:transcriptional regulator with XRE-family HTH domain